uniref:G protein gamma domain-containing protein n=1 Tax=Steinernema glaseri TaxID=37863 RepID=A0A1I7YH76_9BILA
MSGKGTAVTPKENKAMKELVVELRTQAKVVPMKTSAAASDLLHYTEANKADDFLLTRSGWNPFTDIGGQWWMCK